MTAINDVAMKNLAWAIGRVRERLAPLRRSERAAAAWTEAQAIADEDVALNEAIGRHGLALIEREFAALQRPVNVLTHCNAGWVATVDWGTATAPLFMAHARGIPVHVWVDETRPRNQGLLTAWELAGQGVPHTLVADNAGGHLMQRGQVDLVLVGADRVENRRHRHLALEAAPAERAQFHLAALDVLQRPSRKTDGLDGQDIYPQADENQDAQATPGRGQASLPPVFPRRQR